MTQFARRYADVLLALGLAFVFEFWPQLDLALAQRFYVDGAFTGGRAWWVVLTYVVVAKFWLLAFLWIALLLFSLIPRFKKHWAFERRAVSYLLVVLLVGPGLIANTVLKNHWGRPRPVHLVQFGGNAQFIPALHPDTQCPRNCAFVSGHAAAGFYPMAGFWVRRRRRWLVAGIAFGLFVGYVRMAMGAHFLSDVLFAGIVVYFTSRLLAWAFFRERRPAVADGAARLTPTCQD